MKKLASLLSVFLLHLYGLYGVVFSALNVGLTFDEPVFMTWGQDYLQHRDPFKFLDHPPFALWWGAWLPKWMGVDELLYYRLPHVALFFVASLSVSVILWRKAGPAIALVFAAFVNLDPRIKAMAALHVTDNDMAWWLALFTVCLWVYSLDRAKRLPLFAAGLFWGLAIGAKISALFYGPFLALFAARDLVRSLRVKGRLWRHLRLYLAFGLFTLLGTLIAYLGNPAFLAAIRGSYVFSMHHNAGGHITSMFGTYSWSGYWFYHLVMLIAKSPLPLLIAGLLAAWVIARLRALEKSEFWIFLMPGLFLFILLSRANAQVGFRYFNPGLILLWLACAFALGRWFASPAPHWPRGLATGLLAVGLAVDVRTLHNDSYLTYFNELMPKPYRNATEANVDWHQGIPKHLSARFAHTISSEKIFEFLLDPARETTELRAGASELVYFWGSSIPMHLRAFEPAWQGAGHEVYRLSKADLLRVFLHRKPSLPQTWKNEELVEASRPEKNDAALAKPLCPDGRTAKVHALDLLPAPGEVTIEFGDQRRAMLLADVASFLKEDTSGGPVTISGEFSPPQTELAVMLIRNSLGGDLWVNGLPIAENWQPTSQHIHPDYWLRLRPNGTPVRWQLRLPKAPPSELRLRLALLWNDC